MKTRRVVDIEEYGGHTPIETDIYGESKANIIMVEFTITNFKYSIIKTVYCHYFFKKDICR